MRKTNEQFLEEIKDRNFIPLEEYKNSRTNINFQCTVDGNIWSARPNNILNGKGCPVCARRRLKKSLIKINKILEDNGDWVKIDISTKKYKNATALFDKEDFIKFGRRIYLSDQGYCVVHPKNLKKTVKAHRLIHPEWKVTDHINGIRTDNRKDNLRECSIMQNSQNSKKSNSNTGIRGVSYKKNRNKYIAYIGVNYKTIWLGYYKTLKEAVSVRKEAEKKYYKDFAFNINKIGGNYVYTN